MKPVTLTQGLEDTLGHCKSKPVETVWRSRRGWTGGDRDPVGLYSGSGKL